MALFYAEISRFKFPLLIPVHVSCVISIVFRLKYPYSCFSSYSCFLNSFIVSFLSVLNLFLMNIAVLGRSNKFFFALFFIYSSRPLNSWVYAILKTDKSYAFFFPYTQSLIFHSYCVRPCAVSSLYGLYD